MQKIHPVKVFTNSNKAIVHKLEVVIISIVVTALFACSNELSRGNAKDLLTTHFKFPIEVTTELDIGDKVVARADTKWLETLQSEGLIDYRFIRHYGLSRIISVTLTDKGKKYTVGKPETRGWPTKGQTFVKVRLGDRVLSEITGISFLQGKSHAIIEYQ